MAVPRLTRSAKAAALAVALSVFPAKSFAAGWLDDIGVTLLRSPTVAPTLTGTGIVVATAEASLTSDANNFPNNDFEIDPNLATIAASIPITYFNSSGNSATAFPNSIGIVSGHASGVAENIAGVNGIAPNVAGIFNYEADFFINNIIIPSSQSQLDPSIHIVNQSFVITTDTDLTDYQLADQVYDNFINAHPTVLIISAVGNGPSAGMTNVEAAAACYNGLSVGATEINPGSTGALDPVTGAFNGRTGVDITAEGDATSFTTPIVTGVATLLVQAGSLGLAGPGTQTAAMDARVLKSILMTGATKPATWTHTPSQPLDPQMGAGIVNAYSSYRILTAGMFAPSTRSTVTIGGAHPAAVTGTPVGTSTLNLGWAMQSISSGINADALNDYELTLPSSGFQYILTATLTWNRQSDNNLNDNTWGKFNNLDLFLYNGSNQITASTSTVDNVEQIYLPALSAGSYDLQVLKHGGSPFSNSNVATTTDTYALSWSVALVGDVNWDGVVDIADLSTIASHWQTSQTSIFNGDLNGDGVVNGADFAIAAANWQSGAAVAGGSAAPSLQLFLAPEPASIGLLLAGTLPLLMRRGRKSRATA